MTPQERRIACAEALGIEDQNECPSCHLYRGQGHTSFCTYYPNPDESIADAFVLVEFMREKDWYFCLDSSRYWKEEGWDDMWLAQFLNAEDAAEEMHHQGFGPTPQQAIVSAFLAFVASTKQKP